jgi:hypothetical protein
VVRMVRLLPGDEAAGMAGFGVSSGPVGGAHDVLSFLAAGRACGRGVRPSEWYARCGLLPGIEAAGVAGSG